MTSAHRISKNAVLPTEAPSTPQSFQFPKDRHLLITTPRHVFSWDATGVHTIFSSSRGGIVTAKEAKDGSGVLAIASSSVVVMHDTKRGKSESWGLNAPQDEVRHLEYAADSKTLYLSTSLDGTVQQYSTESSRLLAPVQKHEDAPMALAVSPTGHLLLSASHRPPVIFLKNTAHNTAPVQIQPNASTAPVSYASFHPERPNVFLLAFRDGVIAVYDATRLSRQDKGSYSISGDGEIARLQVTQRAVMTGDDGFRAPGIAPPIAGAAFMPGFKARVVTAGRDGRCKLIDFSKGGEVLRTWHAKAPITSLAILAVKSDADSRPRSRSISRGQRNRTSSSHTIGGPTSTNSIIAISRVDGIVQLYDSVGLLVSQTTVSSQEEKILNLEWAKGVSLSPCSKSASARRFSNELLVNLSQRLDDQSGSVQDSADGTAIRMSGAILNETGLGLPLALKNLMGQPSRKFTVHPNEEDLGTVRYTPSSEPQPLLLPTGASYRDLFSPLKPVGSPKAQDPHRISSPPKSRPRISSQTFKAVPDSRHTALVVDSQRQISIPSPQGRQTGSGKTGTRAQVSQQSQRNALRPARRVSAQMSPARRQISLATDGSNKSIDSSRKRTVKTNAQVLADIRKLSKASSTAKHGTLSSYAASQRQRKDGEPQAAAKGARAAQDAREVDVADSTTWPTDSASLSAEVSNNDIWLTSDSEDDRSQQRRRRMKPLTRPPARQTSRSKVDSSGTISTAADTQQHLQSVTRQQTVDGSTDEQMFSAATHLSPSGTFSPASEDVREMFPRTSSLSPGKRRKACRTSLAKRNTVLSSVAVNCQPKSPWARLKAGKGVRPVQVYEDTPLISGGLPRSDSMTCLTCPETKARVQGLETEVAHLKGEVLALKAILRRNGLPFPACLR